MTLGALWQRLNGAQYRFVVVTTLVSLIAFGRNLLFMSTLTLAELGQIALMQTLVMLVGFVQVGLINGAYIQYAARDRDVNRKLIDMMATGLVILVLLAAVLAAMADFLGLAGAVLWSQTLTIGLFAGVVTLASTWLNNALVADGLLGRSNIINLCAVFISVVLAVLSRSHGLTMALLSVLVQPLIVALGAMVIDPNLRPRALRIDRAVLRSVFRIGLMPFLGGLFLLGMFQVERWSIAAVLGPEALGQFHLVLMYASFWGLIPASLLSTYFPPAKRAYVAQATDALKSIVRRHLRDLGIYFGLALLITVTALPWVVGAVLPDFLSSATLCYIALPGLILMTLRDSASLVMYASAQMQPLLTATILTLAAFSLCLVGLWLTDTFTLGNVLFARMFATLPGTVMLVLVQRRQVAEMVQP